MKELEETIQLMNLSIHLDYYAHSYLTQLGRLALDFRKIIQYVVAWHNGRCRDVRLVLEE
jgi:hypothetical protein